MDIRRVSDMEGALVPYGFIARQIEGQLCLLKTASDLCAVDSSNFAQLEALGRFDKEANAQFIGESFHVTRQCGVRRMEALGSSDKTSLFENGL